VSTAPAAQAVDLSLVALGRSPGTGVTLPEHGRFLLAFRWGWAVVHVAIDSHRRTDTFGDGAFDDDDTPAPIQERLDPIARLHGCRRLGGFAVDVDMTASTGGRRVRSRLGETHGVEPLIDSNGVDQTSVAQPSWSRHRVPDETGDVSA